MQHYPRSQIIGANKLLIVIDGLHYDLTAAVGGASLNSLRELKKAHGITVPTINANFQKIITAASSEDPDLLLEDDEFIDNMIAIVWLTKRKAGQDITWDQAGESSFGEMRLLDDEVEVDPDPKEMSSEAANDPEPQLTQLA